MHQRVIDYCLPIDFSVLQLFHVVIPFIRFEFELELFFFVILFFFLFILLFVRFFHRCITGIVRIFATFPQQIFNFSGFGEQETRGIGTATVVRQSKWIFARWLGGILSRLLVQPTNELIIVNLIQRKNSNNNV